MRGRDCYRDPFFRIFLFISGQWNLFRWSGFLMEKELSVRIYPIFPDQ